MAKLTIINPVAEAQANTLTAERFSPAKRPSTLDGKRVALYWNAKAGGEVALARTREQLERLYPKAAFIDVFGDQGTHMRRASAGLLDDTAARADVAIGTTAD